MAVVGMSNLLEAGVHFGHQTKRWNPKMKEYIYSTRDDIYIMDLQKTVDALEKSYEVLKNIVSEGGKILFVGTKKQAQEVCREEAERTGMFYMTERWLGGTLTNFKTIKNRVYRLEQIENMEKDGTFEKLPKKEVVGLKKEYDKLNKNLCGIRNMEKLPQAVIIVDSTKEYNAIREANRLGIPVFGLIDTNCDPDNIDYVIPGNDDAVKSIKVILGVLNNAAAEALNLPVVDYITEDETKKQVKYDKPSKKEIKKEVNAKKEETKIEEICEHEHCHCEKNIALSALKHTLNIFLFIFIITLVINGIIEIIGQENLANIVSKNVILGPIVAGIIGLIPNCASSVVLTELFVENVISMPILISGLCVNAGVGLLVLFKTNENKKENLKIIGLLYAIGVISGLILEIII